MTMTTEPSSARSLSQFRHDSNHDANTDSLTGIPTSTRQAYRSGSRALRKNSSG
jgi:hypothetical protein